MGFHALASVGFRTFDSGWRWFGVRDLFALGRCAVAGSAASIFALWFLGMRDYSRGVILLYAFLVLAFTAALRLSMRLLWQTLAKPVGTRRAAVLGANGSTATHRACAATEPADGRCAGGSHRSRPGRSPPAYSRSHRALCRRKRASLLRKLRADLLVVPSGEELTDEHRRILEQCREAGVPIEQFDVGMSAWKGDSLFATTRSHNGT